MSDSRKKIVSIALPITIAVASVSLVIRFFFKKKEVIPEEVKEVTKNAVRDIENTVTELKDAIENKSVVQLEKNIDNAVESAKTSIDKIASGIKLQLRNYVQDSSSLHIQAS